MKALIITGIVSAVVSAPLGFWAACMCRSAKLGDQGMREAMRSDSLDVQRELAPEVAL